MSDASRAAVSPLIPAQAGIQPFFAGLGPRFRGDERKDACMLRMGKGDEVSRRTQQC
jgi:hypothetical protein